MEALEMLMMAVVVVELLLLAQMQFLEHLRGMEGMAQPPLFLGLA
jgi:hypothetical protein